MKYLAIIGLILTINTTVSAQEDIQTLVNQFCFSMNLNEQVLEKIQQQTDVQQVASAIQKIAVDSTKTEFANTIYLIRQMQKKQISNSKVQEILAYSLSEIAIANKKQAAMALKAMRAFERKHFTSASKENILQVVSFNDLARIEAIEIIGFIGNEGDISFLKGISKFVSLGKKEQYKTLLALVRLGDPESVDQYIQDITSRVINDQLVYSILPDMIYTRNKRVFDFLLQDTQHSIARCYSGNNDSPEKILCAYRILEEIAPYILNFPVSVDRSGSLTGDYETALEKVRKWVVDSQLEYTINTQLF
ncbi:MAG: hypothetical protein J0G96_08380 [Flavobacteriia bacterium]|nr:hypothetical protein [Flavobacteriia bacterium]OJX34927.1 MAG: hypothetical protein BGO87_09305 [Flavobacteriia bacterium 40-80]